MFAWSQNVPIDHAAYRDVTARMGEAEMPGLLVHLAIEEADGTLRYIDVWESEQDCDKAFETVIHPAVHGMLTERGISVAGEPPRTPLTVLEVRYADGSTITA
jgi:hypothetical protein